MYDGIATRVVAPDPYLTFSAEDWGELRASTPLTLNEADLDRLRGINVALSLDEVAKIYLPVSRLLNLYVEASQDRYRAADTFLGRLPGRVPFVIGIAGSVAAGKSTTARVLAQLLERWPSHPKVDLVTTDGFLYPNAELQNRGLLDRKGFPESYDRRRLLEFLAAVKSGEPRVEAPVYSHLVYDVTDELVVVERPDILIVEGLNVLQASNEGGVFVSDFFDFSVFVDADPDDLESWYLERFFTLRDTAFRDPRSYFTRYAGLSDAQARETALGIWRSINARNYFDNILSTRERADLILTKGSDHAVRSVRMRRP